MAEIHVLPGIERRDLCGETLSSEIVLTKAIESGVTGAIVIGLDRSGTLYIAADATDVDRVVGMLMRAVAFLSGGHFKTEEPITG